MRSFPIFRACVSTCRYRESRAATPTVSRSFALGCGGACNDTRPLCQPLSQPWKLSRTPALCLCLCGLQTADQRVGMDVVGEDALPVDLHHRQPLAVAGLELRIAGDVDLVEIEVMPCAHGLEHLARSLAEVTAGRGEERDPDGYG